MMTRWGVSGLLVLTLTVCCATGLTPRECAAWEQWNVPVAGNAYPAGEPANGEGLQRDGTLSWSQRDRVFSIYFHVDRAAKLDLSLVGKVASGESVLQVEVASEQWEVTLDNQDSDTIPLGTVEIAEPGYVRVDLRGVRAEAERFAVIERLVVESNEPGLTVTRVASNEGSMFYWGRRGPSVHLSYRVADRDPIEYAYNELTIPEGSDPIGSYFMANGFGEGYFGIQVNSPRERRVLFSIWSPFQTDNPRDIPEHQRIVVLAKGPDVRVGEFGNEGSGGQSFLVYPWKAGRTYRFLTRVRPDGEGNTVYTSWFGDKANNEWRLIASFRRPETDKHLTGFHSFLENFNPDFGNRQRLVNYSQVWVRDVQGDWHECTQARFSVDATGGNRHRLDFAGGADGASFWLRNCGFFEDMVEAGARFDRRGSGEPPAIDLESLPLE
ncbi:MAG: DUF3472 domain-containing protein [Planctomycetales bacterium]|nr:DUF3472 domain-containing protein [Planctomycetales bacterium]